MCIMYVCTTYNDHSLLVEALLKGKKVMISKCTEHSILFVWY